MKGNTIQFAWLAAVLCATTSNARAEGKHLFILSGQSNMARFNETRSFVPAIEAAFGKQNVIVVKDAQGGKPIRCWYKAWKAPDHGKKKLEIGALYDRLMAKVRKATEGQEIQTVTVLWMQGEQDARESTGDLYRASLEGLIRQFESDLGRKELHFLVGRLSDFGIGNSDWPHWDAIRKCQQEVAESSDRFAWVNTDDLNDGVNKQGQTVENALHYTKKGYQVFGTRMAEAAISLIKKETTLPNDEAQRLPDASDGIVMRLLRPKLKGQQISPTWVEINYLIIDARHPNGIKKLQLWKPGAKKAERSFTEADRHKSGYFFYNRRFKSGEIRDYKILLWPNGTDPTVDSPITSNASFSLEYRDPKPDFSNYLGFVNIGNGDVIDANDPHQTDDLTYVYVDCIDSSGTWGKGNWAEDMHVGYRDDDGIKWVELVINGPDGETVLHNETALIFAKEQAKHGPYWAQPVDPTKTKSPEAVWPEDVEWKPIEGFGLHEFAVPLKPGIHKLRIRATNNRNQILKGPEVTITARSPN